MPAFKLPKLADPKQESVFDPLYETLIRRAASVLGGDDPVSSIAPTPLLAGVKPEGIRILKKLGLKRLEEVKKFGLPFGKANTDASLNPSTMEALEYAQKRYPRLFGHIYSVTDIDPRTADIFGGSHMVRGASTQSPLNPKFSRLELNPKLSNPTTIGHELLHSADMIATPKEMGQRYQFFNDLPGGYNANSMEIRARNMGDILVEKLARDKAAGKPISNLAPEVEPNMFTKFKDRFGF